METILINRIKSGDNRAFRKLYEKYVNDLYRFLVQFANGRNDLVNDWVQNTFIKVYKNINKFEGKSKFTTWLFAIGLNEMRMGFRKENKYNSLTLEEVDNDENFTEEKFEWHIDMKWLLEDLDEEKKAIFILFEVEGYSHSEISDMLKISQAKSRTSLSRIKKHLQSKWELENS